MMDPKLTTSKMYLKEVSWALRKLDDGVIEEIVDSVFEAYLRGRGVYIFGNGGSAALASHLACDLAKNVTFANGSRRLRAMSLTDNFSLISAWSNDVGYECIFVEQLRNFLTKTDLVFAISGSGNSPNVLRAVEYAAKLGARAIGITGRDGGKMARFCEPCLIVPSQNMQIIEDLHTITVHGIATALYNRIVAVNAAALGERTTVARAANA